MSDYSLVGTPTTPALLAAEGNVAFSELTAAATTETIDTGITIPTNAVITGFVLNVSQAFAGGSIATYVVQLGTAGDTDAITGNVSVFTTGVKLSTVVPGAGIVWTGGSVRVAATASHNLSTATAGAFTFKVLYYEP